MNSFNKTSLKLLSTLSLCLSLLPQSSFAMGRPTTSPAKPSPSKPIPAKPAPAKPPVSTPSKPIVDPNDPYAYVDPSGIVPATPKREALKLYDQMKASLKNPNFLTVIDFSQYSGKKRFYLIDMRSGSVEAYKTAHGSGSDSNHDGYAEKFSNTSGSNASSLGLYRTAETYNGKHGYSLRLDGLSSTNSNARSRAIVVHAADYVNDDTSSKSGRSWGCPALDPSASRRVINFIAGGSLIYAWK